MSLYSKDMLRKARRGNTTCLKQSKARRGNTTCLKQSKQHNTTQLSRSSHFEDDLASLGRIPTHKSRSDGLSCALQFVYALPV